MPEVLNVNSAERRPLLLFAVLMLQLLAKPSHVRCVQTSSSALKIVLGGHFPARQVAGHHWLVFKTGVNVHGKVHPFSSPPKCLSTTENKTTDFVSHHVELTSHQWGARTWISLADTYIHISWLLIYLHVVWVGFKAYDNLNQSLTEQCHARKLLIKTVEYTLFTSCHFSHCTISLPKSPTVSPWWSFIPANC